MIKNLIALFKIIMHPWLLLKSANFTFLQNIYPFPQSCPKAYLVKCIIIADNVVDVSYSLRNDLSKYLYYLARRCTVIFLLNRYS